MDIDKVKEIIKEGRETEIIDFKEQFHDNKAELLHDILCLANNTQFQDAYIVFGINDKGETIGVESQLSRIKLADIHDFLNSKRSIFFNNDLPEVNVISLDHLGHKLDVLEIKSTFKVPFFLLEHYQVRGKSVLSGHIYSRTGDRNTPINQCASPNQIEELWKKRFFLLEIPIDYLLHILDIPAKWIKQNKKDFQSESYYYENKPEYTIVENHDEYEPGRTDYPSFAQADQATLFGNYNCLHNTTCLKRGDLIILDGGRTTIPMPSTKSFRVNLRSSFLVDYYLENSIEYKILKLFNPEQHEWDNVSLHVFLSHTLVFVSIDERNQFFKYIEKNVPTIYQKIQDNVSEQYFDPAASSYVRGRLATGYTLKKALDGFRNFR